MTKYLVFTQHVSLNAVLSSSFQKGVFFILVMKAQPKVSCFRKPYFSKKIQSKKGRRRTQLSFLGIFSILFGQNIGFPGSCGLCALQS